MKEIRCDGIRLDLKKPLSIVNACNLTQFRLVETDIAAHDELLKGKER